jgi:hypothetical protein
MTTLTWALKEWAIAVKVLLAGQSVLLIRKGGIREAQPVFKVPSDRVLLFPTYEHQTPSAVRPPWTEQVVAQSVPRVGDRVSLPGWATITHQWPLTGPDVVTALRPFHIWTDEWLAERLAWKPERPAYALLLRVHRFVQPLSLTYQAPFGGCRSWIELDSPPAPALPKSEPVLSAADYNDYMAHIQQALTTTSV